MWYLTDPHTYLSVCSLEEFIGARPLIAAIQLTVASSHDDRTAADGPGR
jgi:hypothetical protein